MRGVLVVTAAATLLATGAAGSLSRAASTQIDVGSDFNGDGFADLAVGVPGEDSAAGAVQVIYGTVNGLNGDAPIDDQYWTEDGEENSVIRSEPSDHLGSSLATGDFDGDGFDDLAFGVPDEDVDVLTTGSVRDAGTVYVLHGSRSGLLRRNTLTQDFPGLGSVEPGDRFGASLTAADFGRGPEEDLAIGVPGQNVGSIASAGAVNVIYGSSTGLIGRGSRVWHQDSPRVPGAAEAGDRFGFSLEAADLGRNPQADLVVGVPYEDVGSARNAGLVNVIYGSPVGLTSAGATYWHQNSLGVPGAAEAGDSFGFALAAANFGRGSHADLAVGTPNEDVGGVDSGSVNVLYGSPSGVGATGAHLMYQGTEGVQGDPEEDDSFGYALAAADFGRGSFADLAVGVPGEGPEPFGVPAPVGAVNVFFGSSAGLGATADQYFWQDSSGFDGAIEGDSELGDRFGASLAAADFGRGSVADVAVGVPGESEEHFIGEDSGVGAVNVLYGDGARGLRASDDQFWWQASDSLHDSAEENDHFGAALAD